MNTHETYVSLEVAKLLKEAGFDWEGTAYYQHGVFYPYSVDRERLVVMNQSSAPSYMEQYSAPTLDVTQRWLREVKNIDVVVSRAMQWNQFYYTIEYEENRTSKIDFMSLNEDMWWLKYEEAQEAGIKKVLEIILEKGE